MNGASPSDSNPSGVQGVCPAGWHLPGQAEWEQLIDYLGGDSIAGGKLKETGTTHWESPNTGATNESGFTALPGGEFSNYGVSEFMFEGHDGLWWSAARIANRPVVKAIRFSTNKFDSSWTGYIPGDYGYGYSVRCVKD